MLTTFKANMAILYVVQSEPAPQVLKMQYTTSLRQNDALLDEGNAFARSARCEREIVSPDLCKEVIAAVLDQLDFAL